MGEAGRQGRQLQGRQALGPRGCPQLSIKWRALGRAAHESPVEEGTAGVGAGVGTTLVSGAGWSAFQRQSWRPCRTG